MISEAQTEKLYELKTCSLLHDIGKLECWAQAKPYSEHARCSYRFVNELLGEDYALTCMRHHTETSFSKEHNPQTEEEKIVWLANTLSSVGDTKGEDNGGLPSCKPPFRLTHVLSRAEPIGIPVDSQLLEATAKEIAVKLKALKESLDSDPERGYLELFNLLAKSRLSSIPADPREGVNDVSLWDHLKLTAAFATCIWLDGGYRGAELNGYEFALVSGDADKISRYVNVSSRLPDLNARSDRVRLATEKAGACITDLLGPECLVFVGGGGVLAISPVSKAEAVSEAIEIAFEEATDHLVTITTNPCKTNGDRVKDDFGKFWKETQWQMRLKKSEKSSGLFETLSDELRACDVCHVRPTAYDDKERVLPLDASPRPEGLCEFCWKLRQDGHGIWLDRFKDEAAKEGKRILIAFLRADGDNIGKVLGKAARPSRLAAISSLIHNICEEKLRETIISYGGRCLIAGGDDILAIVPGKVSLDVARTIASEFKNSMAGSCTMSVGIAILHSKLPVYAGLEAAEKLLRMAKQNPSKDSAAFAIISGLGYAPDELKGVSHGPWRWSELGEILDLSRMMAEGGVASTQIRSIAETAKENQVLAEAQIQNLMGKGIRNGGLEWSVGKGFLFGLKSGILMDAFTVYNAFKEKSD